MRLTELKSKKPINIQQVDDNTFVAEIDPKTNKFLTLQFEEINPELLGINFDVNGEVKLTGKGDQFKVAAAVLEIIKTHLLSFITPQIQTVFFSAKVEKDNNYSRINLYYNQGEPLISNLLNTVGKWEFQPARHPSEVHFIWERISEEEESDPNNSPFLMNEFKKLDTTKYKNYTKFGSNGFRYTLRNGKKLELYFFIFEDTMEIAFAVDDRTDLTKEGGAFEIFNVIRTILHYELLKKITPQIETIIFTADVLEPSRVKFYTKYAAPLVNSLLPQEWEMIDPMKTRTDIKFIWKKEQQYLYEGLDYNKAHKIISKFLKFAKQELELNQSPKLHLITDKEHSIKQSSFGGYVNGHIYLTIGNRHINDCLRSLAHELVHFKQDLEGRIKEDSGKDGSPEENEANAKAAVILRKWGKKYPNLFGLEAIEQQS